MPSTYISRNIRAPQSDVWALLADVEHANRWNRAWSSIELTSSQTHGRGTTFRARMEGSNEAYAFEICDYDAPERIAFCPLREPGEFYSIRLESHVFQVARVSDEESQVTITAHADASGVRGRFVAMFFWGNHQRDGLNLALDAIQAVFEPELFADSEEDHDAELEPTLEPETPIQE